jgi:hypothetical protein
MTLSQAAMDSPMSAQAAIRVLEDTVRDFIGRLVPV